MLPIKQEKCKNDFQSDDNFCSRSASPEDRSLSLILARLLIWLARVKTFKKTFNEAFRPRPH